MRRSTPLAGPLFLISVVLGTRAVAAYVPGAYCQGRTWSDLLSGTRVVLVPKSE